MVFKGLQEGGSLQFSAAARDAEFQRMRAFRNRFFISMNDQARPDRLREFIAKLKHFFEFVSRIDVKQREGNGAGMKGFSRNVDKYTRVFTDRIKNYGI